MKLDQLVTRDPYIVPYNGIYYLYRSSLYGLKGWDCFTSTDLENWEGPHPVFDGGDDFWGVGDFWAPEVHEYKGKFYLLASCKGETRHRGTAIYQADTPAGPFRMWSDGPVTPEDWTCIDGTLYVDPTGVPYMVFVHEWWQVCDGEMQAVQLSEDLRRPVSDPVLLFTAHQAEWVRSSPCSRYPDVSYGYITDGPFFHRLSNGTLCMIWSSKSDTGYAEAVAYSDSGSLFGPWRHPKEPLFAEDGGHGMFFTDFSGKFRLVMHNPNSGLSAVDSNMQHPHPILFDVFEENGELFIRRSED